VFKSARPANEQVPLKRT